MYSCIFVVAMSLFHVNTYCKDCVSQLAQRLTVCCEFCKLVICILYFIGVLMSPSDSNTYFKDCVSPFPQGLTVCCVLVLPTLLVLVSFYCNILFPTIFGFWRLFGGFVLSCWHIYPCKYISLVAQQLIFAPNQKYVLYATTIVCSSHYLFCLYILFILINCYQKINSVMLVVAVGNCAILIQINMDNCP